jgi:transposase
MLNELSADLRKKIVRLWLHEGIQPIHVALTLRLDRKTVLKYVKLYEETGDVQSDAIASARSKLPQYVIDAAWLLLNEDCTLYLDEVAARLNAPPINANLNVLGVWRMYRVMGISRQKVSNQFITSCIKCCLKHCCCTSQSKHLLTSFK